MKCEDCGHKTLEAIWADFGKGWMVRVYCSNCHILDTIPLAEGFCAYKDNKELKLDARHNG
jgi:hypothetical protein